MWSNLTTKRGDSGSAGLPEEKCVIIEAPKTDTKSDQKWCHQQKITKNHQKSTKHKNSKIEKTRKSEKTQKQENWKSEKVIKLKSEKTQKIVKKVTPPENGQNVR